MQDQSEMIPAWVDGTLRPVGKLEVHRLGLRHPAISVFVLAGDLVLIQRRAAGKYHTPGLWANTCCTHPQWGEAPLACAQRRLRQELGISGLHPAFRGEIEYRADVGQGMVEHEVVSLFAATSDVTLSVRPDPDEVAETRWVSLSELTRDCEARPQIYTPWLRIYLSRHAHRLGVSDLRDI